MYHSFLIHLSADGHLGCFHVMAIINSAAMNLGVHVPLSVLVSSVCMPRSGIAGSYGSSISSFLRNFWTLWEKARLWWSERTASKHVYYQVWNKSPVQVGCMRQVLGAGAWRWTRGMGWEFKMGNTCKSMADSCQCMAKTLQILWNN